MANQKPDVDVAVDPIARNKMKKLFGEEDVDQRAVHKLMMQ